MPPRQDLVVVGAGVVVLVVVVVVVVVVFVVVVGGATVVVIPAVPVTGTPMASCAMEKEVMTGATNPAAARRRCTNSRRSGATVVRILLAF